MKVTLTHTEVIEACREWVKVHHNIKVEEPTSVTGYTSGDPRTVYFIKVVNVEFSDVKNNGGPYR